MNWWQRRRRLIELGVMGMNRRNGDFVQRYNQRRLYPLVDDKLRTKQLALDAEIAVPELYGVVEINRQIRELPGILEGHEDFVIKPAHGAGGDGILVVTDRYRDRFRRASGTLVTQQEIDHHVTNILSGMYSLGGQPDAAMIEYRVLFDPLFEAISYQGVPDIRTLVFHGYPIMAMVRLPTRMSDGKANLHQGAVGVGIDITTGITGAGVCSNEAIDRHPDTGNPIDGLQIPHWDRLLELAARCYEITGLGYLGVDVVLDKQRGPLILELNARPGLNIQIANRTGLCHRLAIIESEFERESRDSAARVDYVQRRFAAVDAA